MSATKIGGNTNNILNLFFQNKFTLWHIRLYIYRCKTKCIFYKQYFFCSSLLDKCKEDWCRPKHPTSFPCSVSKEASHKLLKVAAAKKHFPSVFIVDTTCFDEYFSFHVITANSIFYTYLSLPRGLVQPPCCYVLSNKCFERSPYFIFIISTIILQWC